MSLQRITFSSQAAAEAFAVPRLGRARISLAWWEPDCPEPVFVLGPHGGPSTVVLVWPTDRQGMLTPGATQQGLWRAQAWHLDEHTFARLGDLHRAWDLDRHDLWVSRDEGLVPRPDTLRDWPGLRAEAAIAGAVDEINEAGPAHRRR